MGFWYTELEFSLAFDDSARNMNETIAKGLGKLRIPGLIEPGDQAKEVVREHAKERVGMIGLHFSAWKMTKVEGDFIFFDHLSSFLGRDARVGFKGAFHNDGKTDVLGPTGPVHVEADFDLRQRLLDCDGPFLLLLG